MTDTRSKPPRANWSISQRNANSAGLYALSLIDLDDLRFGSDDTSATTPAAVSERAFLEFAFKVNPKSMNLEEPASTNIVPTQGGQFIESQGAIYKNIVVNGTTGLRPNRSAVGAIIPLAGIVNPLANTAVDEETGLPVGERTGFDDLIDLRNLVRRYWDLKDDPARAPTTVMVWQNGKDGEYYIVEPLNFRTERDASAPLTSTYTFQLRTIERLDVAQVKRQYDYYTANNGPTGFFGRLSDIKRQLAVSFQLAFAFTDRTATIAQSTVSGVLTPVNNIIQALTGVVTSGRRFFDIPQNALAPLAQSAVDIAVALDNLPNNSYVTDGVASQIAYVSNAYKNMGRQLRRLANETSLFVGPLSSTVSDKWRAYENPVTGMPSTSGSPTALGNVNPTNGSMITYVGDGESIRDIAQRALGDSTKWKTIAIMNRLRQPYISARGDGINVLRPGDEILVPQSVTSGLSGVAPTGQKFTNVSTLNQRMGRDIRLVSSGDNVYDFAVSSSGDLAEIEGLDNMSQAMLIKFSVEQGELPTHPLFGLRFPLGTKARLQALIAFNINARATLLSDQRIASVDNLKARLTGNVLRLTGSVTVKGVDQTQNFDFSVRR